MPSALLVRDLATVGLVLGVLLLGWGFGATAGARAARQRPGQNPFLNMTDVMSSHPRFAARNNEDILYHTARHPIANACLLATV